MVVDPTGVKDHVKFGDSRSNRSRDKRLSAFSVKTYIENGLTQNDQIYRNIYTDPLYSFAGYDVTSYFQTRKIVENAASDGFGWNLSRTV